MIRATKADKPRVVEILTQAFDANPSVNYTLPQDSRSRQRLVRLMEYSVEVCQDSGEIYLSEDKNACALLLRPEQKRTTLKALWRDVALVVCCVGLGKVKALLDREAKIKAAHPRVPFYHLWYIGVLPSCQQQGIGTQLLQDVIAHARQQNRALYLETSVPSNVAWYQKAGFEVFHRLDFSYVLSMLRLGITR